MSASSGFKSLFKYYGPEALRTDDAGRADDSGVIFPARSMERQAVRGFLPLTKQTVSRFKLPVVVERNVQSEALLDVPALVVPIGLRRPFPRPSRPSNQSTHSFGPFLRTSSGPNFATDRAKKSAHDLQEGPAQDHWQVMEVWHKGLFLHYRMHPLRYLARKIHCPMRAARASPGHSFYSPARSSRAFLASSMMPSLPSGLPAILSPGIRLTPFGHAVSIVNLLDDPGVEDLKGDCVASTRQPCPPGFGTKQKTTFEPAVNALPPPSAQSSRKLPAYARARCGPSGNKTPPYSLPGPHEACDIGIRPSGSTISSLGWLGRFQRQSATHVPPGDMKDG